MRECTAELFFDGNSCRIQSFPFLISKQQVLTWFSTLDLPPCYAGKPSIVKDEFPFAMEAQSANGKHRIGFKFWVSCPYCGYGKLDVKHDGPRASGYVCPDCKAVFDSTVHTRSKYTLYLGKHRSKQHMALLNSEDTLENFLKSLELETKGIPLHDNLILMYGTMP